MRKLRLFWRLGSFIFWTLGCYLILLLANIPKTPAKRFRARAGIATIWAKGVCTIWHMRVRVYGEIPKEPFILVSNHLGYADIVLLSTLVDSYFISKEDVKSWPVLGQIVRYANILFLNRENSKDLNRVEELLEKKINEGSNVVFFPEGTSSRGEEVLHFKSSLFNYPANKGIPIHTAAISYSTPEGEMDSAEAVCWWGDMDFASHFIKLLQLKSFDARVRFANETVQGENRKSLALKAQESVSELFEPADSFRDA